MRRSLLISLVLLVIARTSAMGQTCLGLVPFSRGSVQLTGQGSFTNGSKALIAGLAYGLPSVFGGIEVGRTAIEAFEGSSLNLGAALGYQMALGKQTPIQVCPLARFNLAIGPRNTFNSGVDRLGHTASMGVLLGTSLGAGPRTEVIPTAGLSYAYSKTKAEDATGTPLVQFSDNYGIAQLGVGLVLNSNLSIRPGVDIPLGLQGSDPVFGLTVGYNFGRSRH